jgi:hypothetical protein
LWIRKEDSGHKQAHRKGICTPTRAMELKMVMSKEKYPIGWWAQKRDEEMSKCSL